MSKELEQLLSELELGQLRDIAERYGIDCSDCNLKEDYIEKISESPKVEVEDVRSLYGMSPETKILVGQETLPNFNEIEQLLKETKNIFDSGNYIAAIDKATEAIDAISRALNAFYGASLSFAIRSSENMLSNARNLGIEVTPLEEALDQIKQSYEKQEYETVGAIFSQLREAMNSVSQEHNNKVSELIDETQSLIDKGKEIDVDTTESEVKLQEARNQLASNSLLMALENVKEAESLLNTAKEERVSEISKIIDKASDIIEEARYLNAPVSEAEEILESARKDFEDENYNSAIENANRASELANSAREEQIKRVMSIQEKMKTASVIGIESEAGAIAGPSEIEETAELEQTEKAGEATEEIFMAIEEEEAVEELKPTEVGKVCPKCGGEPTYVEQYKKYYCYTCSEYVEPIEKVKEEKPKVVAKPIPKKRVCPKCGGEPTYVEQYKKYYCYTCSEYVEPVEKVKEEKPKVVAKPIPKKKVCPKCGGEPTYVEQYKKYYCYTCSEYVEPVEKVKEEKPKVVAKPIPKRKVCPKCGGEPTYVEQYKKYYCYTCSEYVEPIEKIKEEKPKAVVVSKEKVCPKCGGEPTYVEQYKKYYCYNCNEYVQPIEKVKKAAAPSAKLRVAAIKVCPKCGGEPTYIEQYKKYYCYTCNEYVEPIPKSSQAKANTCPTCGGTPTYVEQYKRYYCYTCNKYL